MKKRILKIIVIFILFIIAGMQLYIVDAKTTDINVKYTIDDFCKSLEKNSTLVYRYIDSNNSELRDTINSRMDSIQKIKFTTKDISEEDGITTVTGKIEAKGDDWNIDGFTVKFEIKDIDGTYKIVNTDLFEKINPENIAKMAISIVAIVFIIIGVVFFVITITVIIIIVVVVKNNKKK